MDTDQFELLFALLAMLANLLTVGIVVGKVVGRSNAAVRQSLNSLAPMSLWGGTAVAATCMFGSLYLSEVAKYPPCDYCWYQRIAMYPLVAILGVAAIRRDHGARFGAWLLCAIGFGFSTYHYLHEWFPDSVTTACDTKVPCSTRWVFEFGYISIPFMAGSGFLLIAALLSLTGGDDEPESVDDSAVDHSVSTPSTHS